MVANEEIRKEIQRRVQNVPQEKLETLLDFVKQLEQKEKANGILKYFGLWEDMDESTFSELTTGLTEKRLKEDSITNHANG